MGYPSDPLKLTRWNDIDWFETIDAVKGLRQQIFRASKSGDKRKLKSLQRLMLKSKANAAVSVRQATQINKGRGTPGTDDRIALTGDLRTELMHEILSIDDWTPQPARRVYIPKANGKTRPLGIPAIADRCKQAMVKNALEPQWEALFEPCSYGFRPGRSCHDAIGRIFRVALPHGNKKWVVDALSTTSATNTINPVTRISAIGLVEKWLKAGVMDEVVDADIEGAFEVTRISSYRTG